MNPRLVGLIPLILAAGCKDSMTSLETDHKVDNQASDRLPDVQPSISEHPVVRLTDAAIAKFKEFLSAAPKKHIRLSVKYEGPTGYMYDLQIDDAIKESDIVDKSNGFTFVVDRTSSVYLDGATIDWQIQPDGQAGFKSDNPNALEQ